MCDLQLTGANKLAPLLHGGLDGIYKLHTCESGRPAFRRTTGPENGKRGDTAWAKSARALICYRLQVLTRCAARCRNTAPVVLNETQGLGHLQRHKAE